MILVTGAAGFLGSALVESLLERGATQIRCLLRPGTRQDKLLGLAKRFPKATMELVFTGLADPRKIKTALEGVETIYHLAAAMGGSPADMYMGTVVASKRLLDALSEHIRAGNKAPRVVLVSSMGVYGVATLPRRAMVDETTQLEASPELRDVYTQTKLRQEKLFQEYAGKLGLSVITLRPGVIYGPGGNAMSSRVGLNVFGIFLDMGGANILPLTYVKNCADAVAIAGEKGRAGEVYNVVDDDLPTCGAYLREYTRRVKRMITVPTPYVVSAALARVVTAYHRYSKGQLPAILTPYRTAASWKGNRFENAKIKGLGWSPRVSTAEGMDRTFTWLHDAAA